jgi:hypothetical protein
MPKHQDQADCTTFEELADLLTVRAGGKPSAKTEKETGEESESSSEGNESDPIPESREDESNDG